MKKIYYRTLLLLAAIGLLAGCGHETKASEAEAGRMQVLLSECDAAEQRAETFAEHLCVLDGSEPAPDASVEAEAAAVFSLDSQKIILARDATKKLYPASMTKILTALVAIRYGDVTETMTVGDEAVITESGASLCNIKPGDTLTLEQLLYGLMLPSGNDAGAAIAVHIAGSIEAFSDLMNEEAHRIGATDSHFTNPHGLHDENHYTTAYDLYLIYREAMQEPLFRKIISTASYTVRYQGSDGTEKQQLWKNSNRYINGDLAMPDGLSALGGKTGTTKAAGYCLITGSADEKQQEYVSVIMNAPSRSSLYDGMTNIIQKIVN